MAVLKTARTSNIYGAMRYNTGTAGDRPALEPVCVGPGGSQYPLQWALEAQELAKNTRGRARRTGHIFVLAFGPHEFDPKNPRDQARALAIAQAYVEETAPDSPFSLVVHDDKGHLHVHGIIANVEMSTNRPLGQEVSF